MADISAALADLAPKPFRLIDQRPRHGSMGASIAFLHPADLGGVLTELVEPADRLTPEAPLAGLAVQEYPDMYAINGAARSPGPARPGPAATNAAKKPGSMARGNEKPPLMPAC